MSGTKLLFVLMSLAVYVKMVELKTFEEPSAKQLEKCCKCNGVFKISDTECERYLMCEDKKANVMRCAPGLAFNPAIHSCDWKKNVPRCDDDKETDDEEKKKPRKGASTAKPKIYYVRKAKPNKDKKDPEKEPKTNEQTSSTASP